jgi:hypothetical protein
MQQTVFAVNVVVKDHASNEAWMDELPSITRAIFQNYVSEQELSIV